MRIDSFRNGLSVKQIEILIVSVETYLEKEMSKNQRFEANELLTALKLAKKLRKENL